ncbi:MAG: cupin domain-containing protein [Deltaproteobacteria bacterium]|nr:cupin domain-containing protein [Deltaproteobacteria bacterium]MBI3077219.1 cupin domain-containing protein [Deltaproteobacteria bacterium]
MKERVVDEATVAGRMIDTPEGLRESRVLLDPDHKEFAMGMETFEPGHGTHLHAHPHNDEFFYIVQGSGVLRVEDQHYPFRAGYALHIPRGKRHQITNTGQELLKLTWAFVPGALYVGQTLPREP